MTKFEETLKHAFTESRHELSMQNRKTDAEYKSHTKKHNELYDEIKILLGDNRKLISDYEAATNEMGSIDDEFVYLQGMIDCVKLLRIIKMI
ncbi:MAG: hypothetical protein LBC86_07170 [Oscillospiraceae bacterium]|jgi:hypothetical protein|nr:hypothetical protein [Oscillospiraceae bacterium]